MGMGGGMSGDVAVPRVVVDTDGGLEREGWEGRSVRARSGSGLIGGLTEGLREGLREGVGPDGKLATYLRAHPSTALHEDSAGPGGSEHEPPRMSFTLASASHSPDVVSYLEVPVPVSVPFARPQELQEALRKQAAAAAAAGTRAGGNAVDISPTRALDISPSRSLWFAQSSSGWISGLTPLKEGIEGDKPTTTEPANDSRKGVEKLTMEERMSRVLGLAPRPTLVYSAAVSPLKGSPADTRYASGLNDYDDESDGEDENEGHAANHAPSPPSPQSPQSQSLTLSHSQSQSQSQSQPTFDMSNRRLTTASFLCDTQLFTQSTFRTLRNLVLRGNALDDIKVGESPPW